VLGSPQANISQASDGESDRELILTREEIAFLQGLFADKDFEEYFFRSGATNGICRRVWWLRRR